MWFFATIAVNAAPEAISPPFLLDTAVHIPDTDGDKMPNLWELANGLNPALDDAAGNPDGDHLDNLAEYNAGTRPLVFDFTADRSAVSGLFALSLRQPARDQDGDGMPDSWETSNGLNPAVDDSAGDSDSDGLGNLAEYNAGWNPRVSEKAVTLSARSGVFLANTGAYPGGFARDTDNDGMPDWWETSYGLNLAVKDGGLDPDFDGLTNLQEYLSGRHPRSSDVSGGAYQISQVFVGNFSNRLPDTDHDGIPDIWESTFGTNPLVADSVADPDGDGRSNLSEYNAGTNPLVNDWKGPGTLTSVNFLTDTGGFNGGYGPDSDHDGMPDRWELQYGLNPLVADANGNPDADALNNLEEYNAGSDPSKFGFLIQVDAQGNIFTCDTGGALVDSDKDGIPDWWEEQNTGNRTGMSPTADSDGDGKNNLAEYVAGLNPLDPASRFEIRTSQMTTDAQGPLFQVRWKTVPNRLYKVFTTGNLGEPWSTVPVETVVGDGVDHVVGIRPGALKHLFVRIEVEVIK
ncbi:hypothetical protein GCM10023212_10810 [Luteolibacter yonseiensis]